MHGPWNISYHDIDWKNTCEYYELHSFVGDVEFSGIMTMGPMAHILVSQLKHRPSSNLVLIFTCPGILHGRVGCS